MSTEYQIRANFNRACSTAAELEEMADLLKRIANAELSGTLTSLQSAWSGENADKFIKKGSKVKEEILNTAATIRNAAAGIRSDAKSTYDAEMRAYEIACKRAAQERRSAQEMEVFGHTDAPQGGGGSR